MATNLAWGKKMTAVLFGNLGKILLVMVVVLVAATAIALPYVMVPLHLVFPKNWVLATRIIVQIAFGAWVATSAVQIARIKVWLRALYSRITPVQYDSARRDISYVGDFTLWLLGILTALAAYMTVWVSG
jgi:hypothetical protein